MSDSQQLRADTEGRSKKALRREPGACEPCKYFKTKCDHQMPCGACRDDTQRYSPCAYSKRAVSMQNHEAKSDPSPSDQRSIPQDSTPYIVPDTADTQSHSQSGSRFFLGLLSIPLVIDKFKYLKSAPGAAQSAISKFDGFETCHSPPKSVDSAQLQSGSSSTSLIVVPLAQLKEEFEAIIELVWTGQVAQAWFQLGNLSRKAYSAFRHARDRQDDSEKLWDRVLQLEIHLSLMLGEPALSSPREPYFIEITSANLWQEEVWLTPTRQLLHKYVQELLALDSTQSGATEKFVNAAGGILAHSAFVQAAHCITEEHSIEARDLQMTVHFIFLLLRCCFAEIAQHDLTLNLEALSPTTRDQIFHKRRSKLLHCRLALKSAKFIINIFRQIFDSSHRRVDIWMQCHAVWIAATFLAIGKVRSEIEWTDAAEKLQHIELLFKDLADTYPDCHLLAPAAAKLHDLNAIPRAKSSNTKKRGANTLEDDSWDSATKRRRRASVDQISTPGRPATKSESEGFSSSSDMMPVMDRQRMHEQSVPLSYGDDSRSIPITPTSILSYNHHGFHMGVEQENNHLEQWAIPQNKYSPNFQVPIEQAIPHYSEGASMSVLSSPIQLFRPGFAPVDSVQYGRMLQPREGLSNMHPTWDGRPIDTNEHRLRHWQGSRFENEQVTSKEPTQDRPFEDHYHQPYSGRPRIEVTNPVGQDQTNVE